MTAIGVSLSLIALFISWVIILVSRRRRIPKGLRLPPGPPPKPFIGNLLDMPAKHEWNTYSRWAKQYGELVYLNVLGQDIAFVNSRRMAYELFDKRASKYSDRPTSVMAHELVDFGWFFALTNYGERWRHHRGLVQEKLQPKAVDVFKPIQLKHIRTLLKLLLNEPEDFIEHIRYAIGSVIMEIAYGLEVKNKKDPHLLAAEAVVTAAAEISTPGRFWVEAIPWRAGFQRKARLWREQALEMREGCFQAAKEGVVSGRISKSTYVSSLLHELETKSDIADNDEGAIRDTAATIFVGGSDTTASTLNSFILIMALFPEVQKKAQQELDLVLEGSRLVEFEDHSSLPYIIAIQKEVMRWHPFGPVGVPHATAEDDVIGKYFIPKGTVIFGHTWGLLHEEAEFGPEPSKFIPERFLGTGLRDPANTGVFGYGRRICPGRFFAQNEIFIAIASILQVFEISFPPDTPRKASFEDYFSSGIVSVPNEFRCIIRPRSKGAEQLIVHE